MESQEHDDHYFDSPNDMNNRRFSDDAQNAPTSEAGTPLTEEEKLRQDLEWRDELIKLEEEILTLKQVLTSKTQRAQELKRKLGRTPLNEFKQDVKQSVHAIKESDAYQKTGAALKTVGTKAEYAWSSISTYTSKKMGDLKNSNAFKSIEEKVGGAYSSVKTKVGGSKSDDNFEHALDEETANAANESLHNRDIDHSGDVAFNERK